MFFKVFYKVSFTVFVNTLITKVAQVLTAMPQTIFPLVISGMRFYKIKSKVF